MKRNYLLLFFIFAAFSTFGKQPGPTGTVKGKVLESGTNQPLIGVVVFLKEDSLKPVMTDENGQYQINAPAGKYHIVCRYISFKRTTHQVEITDGGIESVDVVMEPEQRKIKDVIVKGSRITHTESAVLTEIKRQDNVVVGISSSQIAKTLDRDAGQVVKRVPGVTIIQDRFINVRGLSERYNTVWINNAGVPSSETDKKSFSFDVIPSGTLDRILIFKTPSPELPGDFAGGMVKIYTKGVPDKNQVTVSLSGSYRNGSTGKEFITGKTGKTDWLGYDNKLRVLPSVPEKINPNDDNRYAYSKMFNNPWDFYKNTARPDVRFNFSAANKFKFGNSTLGNTLALFYSGTMNTYNVTRQEWDSVSREYIYLDEQSTATVRAGVMENISFQRKRWNIDLKGLFNQTGTNTTTFRTNEGLDSLSVNERTYVFQYSSRSTLATQLNGGYKSADENTEYKTTIGYNLSNNKVPDLRRITYTKSVGAPDSTYYASVPPGSADPNIGGRFFSDLNEKMYVFNHSLKHKFTINKYGFDVSIGNYVEYKNRDFAARQFGYIIKPSATAFELKYLPVNQIFSAGNVGGPALFNINEITDNTYAYSADNKLIASYLLLNVPVGKRIKVSGGARYEHNTQSLTGFTGLADTIATKFSVTSKYLLPSVNASYNITSKSLVRVAYGKTLNRPEFREWAPFYFYDFEFKALTYGSLYSSIINGANGTVLKVCDVQNFDARYEWYPSPSESFQFGGFYKTFNNPIQSISDFSTGNRTFTFVNAKNAKVYGVEIDARKNLAILDTLLHSRFLSNFNVVANASLIHSSVTFDEKMVQAQATSTPLQGQSPYVFNAGIYYQNDSLGLQLSVLYNIIGPRIIFIGTSSDKSRINPNIGEMPQGQLDATVSKRLGKFVQFTLGVQNLLNSSVRWVQDTNVNGKFEPSTDKSMVNYKQGMYFTAGIKATF